MARPIAKDHNAKVFSEFVFGDEMTEFFSQHWQLVLFYIHNKYDNQNNKEWRMAMNTEKLLKLNLEGNSKADKKRLLKGMKDSNFAERNNKKSKKKPEMSPIERKRSKFGDKEQASRLVSVKKMRENDG